MNKSSKMELSLSQLMAFTNLLHIPAVAVDATPEENRIEIVHQNPPYKELSKSWGNKGSTNINDEFLVAVATLISKDSKGLATWDDNNRNSFHLEPIFIFENKYIVLLHDYSEACVMKSLSPGAGRGCQSIINSMKGGQMVVGSDGVINTINMEMQDILQKHLSTKLSTNSPFELPSDFISKKALRKHIGASIKGKTSLVNVTPVGQNEFRINLTFSPISDLAGKPFAALVSAELLPPKFKQSETLTQILKQSLDLFGDGYLIWTADSNHLFLSPHFYSQLGYKNNGFIPTPERLYRIIHPCDRDRVRDTFRALATGQSRRAEVEFRIRNRNGEYFWVLGRAGVPAYSSVKESLQIVGTTVDINEQMRTKDDLMQSEYRLMKAQEIAHVGSWAEYSHKSKNYWSDETYRIFGIAEGTLSPSLKLVLPMLSAQDRKAINVILRSVRGQVSKGKHDYTIRINQPKAKVKFVRITAEPNYDGTIGKHYWQGVVQDISLQKEYEAKLRKDKENLLGLVQNMPALVLATDRNGKLVFWNRACEEVTGFKAKDLIGNRNALKLLYPDPKERKSIRTQFKEMGNTLSTWEHEISTKRGDRRSIIWSAFSDFVQVEGWNAVAIGYDVTLQRNQERLQAASQRKLEAIAETAISFVGMPLDDSIYHYLGVNLEKFSPGHIYIIQSYSAYDQTITLEGIYGIPAQEWQKSIKMLSWNPVGRKFPAPENLHETFGQSKVQLIEQSLYHFAEGSIPSVASKALERLLSIEGIHTVGLTKGNAILGGVIIFTRSNRPSIDLSIIEGLISQASIALDKRQLELQLVAAKEKAEEADRLKSAFLANMSHEIRTPMNAILGFSQLLNLPNLPEEKRKQYIDIINIKGNVLVKLINDIIDASKVEAGQLTLVHAPCLIPKLLQSLHQFYEKEKLFQQKKPIDIRLTIPPRQKNLVVVTDEGRLEQVFTNLIGNALKFTSRGYIEFGYSANRNSITFFVRDTGPGIDKSQQEIIFDRFRQAEEHTTRSFGGTGLGLSISKGIVAMLGGKIWVDAYPGEGSTFYFSIPNIKPSASDYKADIQGVQMEADDEVAPNWKNRIILIAEDEEVNYIYLNELLEPTGAKVIWAQDGVQAVDLVQNIKRIDAILMDIKMPEKDGYAATMEIRQLNPGIPIIAQTAYAFSEDREKAVAAGCDDYITKPINSTELYGIINRFLQQ